MATIADELNAISVEHGYTGAAPKTIAGAIDALADTLAGTDVEGKRTISGAVKALAPYIGSGGGGSLGSLVGLGNGWLFELSSPPEEGSYLDDDEMASSRLLFGQQVVASAGNNAFNIPMVAAGITVCRKLDDGLSATMYRGTCTDGDGGFMCDSVEEFADYTIADGELRFVIPELEEDEFLAYKTELVG